MAITKKFFLDSRASLEEQTICNILRRHDSLADVCDLDLFHLDDDSVKRIIERETRTAAVNYFLPGATSFRTKPENPEEAGVVYISTKSVYGVPVIRQVLGLLKYQLSRYEDAVATLAMGYVKGMCDAGYPEDKIREFLFRDRMARFDNDYEVESAAELARHYAVNLASQASGAHKFYWVTGDLYRHIEWALVDHFAVENKGESFTVFFSDAPDPASRILHTVNKAHVYTTQGITSIDNARTMLPDYDIGVTFDDRTKMRYVEIRRPDGAGPAMPGALASAFGFINEL